MRRFLPIFITVIIAIIGISVFVGYKNNNTDGTKSNDAAGKIRVTTTIFPPYDFVREIAGDNVELTMLLPPGSESHSYEPSPKDIITIQSSDVFIYVGGESDEWINGILNSMNTDNMKIIPLIKAVDAVEEEIVPGMEDEHESEEEGAVEEKTPELDEHVWTSPKNAISIVRRISDVLIEADAPRASIYADKAKAYIERLSGLDRAFLEVVNNASRKTIIFADRFPFRYLVDAYGLSYYAAFPGCSTETEASVATVVFLIDKINAEKIPVVFHIELSNEKMADTISESTGVKKMLMHSCHNVTADDFTAGLNYLELMTRNVESLKAALW